MEKGSIIPKTPNKNTPRGHWWDLLQLMGSVLSPVSFLGLSSSLRGALIELNWMALLQKGVLKASQGPN